MNLTLPKVETAGKSELKESLTISITKDGGVDVNGHSASMETLAQLVKEIGQISKDVTVVIRSDENTPLRFVTQAMDTCRKQGLNKIRLQSR
jgi:biopolymer transport protein ExbD